uniref:Transmembrane protein n=1 Tax=Lotharella globosa TaxID=91324 RepID=A0A7S3ZIS2_9EUKA|mmetsp:Transcript_24892/g.48721  ORF Transcript_24892/g.48721 Transcript_24892/m.48721 type:complete len:103 (+) Transcript_24892:435-743(+)
MTKKIDEATKAAEERMGEVVHSSIFVHVIFFDFCVFHCILEFKPPRFHNNLSRVKNMYILIFVHVVFICSCVLLEFTRPCCYNNFSQVKLSKTTPERNAVFE